MDQPTNLTEYAFIDGPALESIFELSSEAIWIIDLRTDTRYWIASLENRKKYGIPAGAISAEFWASNVHTDDVERASSGFERSLKNPHVTAYEHEYFFRGGDGRYYRIHDSMRFIRSSDGAAERVIGIWKDVTETRFREKKLEEILSDLERGRDRFKVFSELSNATMWEIDFRTDRVYWASGSRTLEEFDLTKSDYSIADWLHSVHPEDREHVKRNFEAVVASEGENYFDTYRVRKADGSVAHVIDQGIIIRDKAGLAVHAFGTWTDISRERERENALENALQRQRQLNEELKSREEELATSEEELRQINEQLMVTLDETTSREFILNQAQRIARIGSWEYDRITEYVFWSDELYSIYGLEKKFDVNAPGVSAMLFGEQSVILDQCMEKLLTEGTPLDIVLHARTPIGYKKWVRIVGFPVQDDKGITGMRGVTHDITHYKESEERLRTSEEKFSKAFKNNPDLMTIHRESDFVIIDVNDKIEALLGYSREEVVGRPATDLSLFVHLKDKEYFYEMYLKHGNAQMETEWRKKDGSSVFILLASSRIEIEGEWYSLNVIEDVSQRKAAEERFIKAFELSPDLMLIFRERDWVLMEVNNKLEALGGYTRDEVLGKPSTEFRLWAEEEDRNNFFHQLTQGQSASIEAQLLGKGDRSFFAALSAQRIQLSGENHILIVIRDITEKQQAEERIRQSEANITATVNNTSLMVWSVDRDFRVMTFNRALADFMKSQYDVEVILGERVIPESFDDDENKGLRQTWNGRYLRALAGETFRISTQAGELFLDFSLSPIIIGNRVIGVSIFGEDITRRKQDETMLAEANKQVGEMRLMALRSVMNPHFIFNALNSIQYFIAQNDRKNAINYLSTFSKLIRGILTNSVNNRIKLAEELEQLHHYINLELVRFENKFTYAVHVDPGVDVESLEIPSLLIQPYVENAILHGLYNKKEDGILKITVTEDNGSVMFEITDDGIGRTAALALRQQNFPRHKSMGTALTEERLRLINEKENVAVETTDLLHDDGRAAGTRVRIWVRI